MPAATHDLVDKRRREAVAPAAARRLADDDLADVMLAREREHLSNDALAAQVRSFGAEAFGELQRLEHAVARGARQAREVRRLDVDRMPLGVQRGGEPPRRANDALGKRIRADADEHALAR